MARYGQPEIVKAPTHSLGQKLLLKARKQAKCVTHHDVLSEISLWERMTMVVTMVMTMLVVRMTNMTNCECLTFLGPLLVMLHRVPEMVFDVTLVVSIVVTMVDVVTTVVTMLIIKMTNMTMVMRKR